MGMLNKGSEASGYQAMGPLGPPPDSVIAQGAREMNLRERVMTHDQRISSLEEENRTLHGGLEKLAKMLQDQFGLIL